MKLLDVIEIIEPTVVNGVNLPVGSRGTVVFEWSPKCGGMLEIEFIDPQCVITMNKYETFFKVIEHELCQHTPEVPEG